VEDGIEKIRSLQDYIDYLPLIPFLSAQRQAEERPSHQPNRLEDVHDIIGAAAHDLLAHVHDAIAVAAQMVAIVESSDDAIVTAIVSKDLNGIIASWNSGAEKLFGYTAAEVIGQPVTILIPPGRTGEETQILGRIKRREQVIHYETVRRRKDGSEIDVSLTVLPVLNKGGKVIGASKIARDITERKRAEEKLRRSEACLAEGQRLSHTGSWAWNVHTGELFWSQEQFRIFGLDPEKVKPSYEMAFEMVHPEDRSAVRRDFEKAVNEQRDFEANYRITRSDGTIRHMRSLCHPVFNESGALIEYVGTVVDTTERKHAEEAARSAQSELAHAARALTLAELTASIAHEVNQPLGAIVADGQACLRLLGRDEPDFQEVREAVGCMISDAMRAHKVISRIRALLKKNAPEKAPLDINETLQEVIALTAGELGKNQVLLRTELEADLPPVRGDRVELQQVLLNLILNGCEAMSGSGWRPRELLISSRKCAADEVMVSVRDSGVGIDPQTAERLFDAFFTTKEGGLGLGLSISRRIIEAHGGSVWAEPNEGRGATLLFTLPTNCESRL
jgi:PAS domain S-box-containing protein